MFKITPAISFVVACDSQEEIDYYWERLSEDGAKSQCGWLEDKFGVSWQVVPAALERDHGGETRRAVMDALLTMQRDRHRGVAAGGRGVGVHHRGHRDHRVIRVSEFEQRGESSA